MSTSICTPTPEVGVTSQEIDFKIKIKATLIQTHGVPDLSILVDLLNSLQMFPVSVSRNVAGDLFVEMHDYSLVFMLINGVLQSIMHRAWCYFTLIFVFICCEQVHSR